MRIVHGHRPAMPIIAHVIVLLEGVSDKGELIAVFRNRGWTDEGIEEHRIPAFDVRRAQGIDCRSPQTAPSGFAEIEVGELHEHGVPLNPGAVYLYQREH